MMYYAHRWQACTAVCYDGVHPHVLGLPYLKATDFATLNRCLCFTDLPHGRVVAEH